MPRYLLSVIDDRCPVDEAFSRVLHYFDPNKKKNIVSSVLDSTCSIMKMWTEEDRGKYRPTTNDTRSEIEADFHVCCSKLDRVLDKRFDIIIYDPPYVNLKRKDAQDAEFCYNYEASGTIEELVSLTERTAICFRNLISKNGIVIAKICDFHIRGRLRGSYDIQKAFEENGWFLHDKVIYRFYKPIPNLVSYSLKVPIAHTYFLIFKEVTTANGNYDQNAALNIERQALSILSRRRAYENQKMRQV